MRKIYLGILLMLLVLANQNGLAQINYTETFDTDLGGWVSSGAGTFGRTTTTPCAGAGAARVNLYSSTTNATFRSPSLGTSNGGTITLSYQYKIIDWSGGGATPNPWGDVAVQMATATSGPWSTVQTFDGSTHTPSVSCATRTVNFTAPTGDIYIRFVATWSDGDYYLYFDEISATQGPAPSCFQPVNPGTSNVTTSSADVNWQAPPSGTPTGYQWEVRSSGAAGSGATGLVASGTTTAATLTAPVTGLSPATTYSLYVRTDCGGTFSAWTSAYDFLTLCASATIPTAVQSFDAATIPVCWSRSVLTGTVNWAPDTDNDGVPAPHSGARFMGKDWTNSDAIIVSQPINMTTAGATGARINVWVYRNDVNDATDRIGFYINTTADISGAVMLLEIFPDPAVSPTVPSNGWYNYTADIPSSFDTEPTVYIIAQGTTSAGFAAYGIGFDDFKVEAIPTCFEPDNLVVSNATTTGAQLDWNPPASSTPVDYQIYYSTSSTVPTPATTPSATGITGVTHNLTGLTPATTYYVWVRSNCGGTGLSPWIATGASFTTLCNSASVPTAVESFDATTIPVCWSRSVITGTVNWAPDTDNDGVPVPRTGSRFMGKDWTNSDAVLVSQPIDMTTAGPTGARINVWVYRNDINDATDRISFHVNTTPDISGATQILEIFPDIAVAPTVTANGWYNYTAEIPATFNTEPIVYVIAQGTTSAGFAAYGIGFDDFKVEVIPTCAEPVDLTITNTTTTGAELSWTAPSVTSPTDYQVYVSTSSTPPTAATTPTLTGQTAPVTLASLAANTTYYVWVRSNCGPGDLSIWSASIMFTTLCNPVTTFTENFDAVTTPALPSCWSKVGTTGAVSTQNSGASSAPNTMYIYSSTTTNIAMVSLPPVSNLDAGTHRLRFMARANFTVGGMIEVGYLSTPGDQASFTLLQSITANALTYELFEVVPTGVPTGVEILAFRHTGSPANSVLIDNVAWEAIPACQEPTGVNVTNVTTTDAQVDWMPPASGTPVDYQIYYSTSATAPTAGSTPNVTGAAGTTANLTGLTPATTYYLWVRTNCGSSNVSAWSTAPAIFTTQCLSASIPTPVESFDAATIPVCWSRSLITGTVNWAPDTDNDGVPAARTGTRFMGKDWTNSDALIVSQPINMTTAGANGARINVWIYRNSINDATDRIRFHVNTTADLSGATQLLEIFPNITVAPSVMSNGWYNYTADIPSSFNTEPTVYILAQGTTSAGFAAYGIGFDDFKVEAIPSCNEPTGVVVTNPTTTGAQVDWNAPSVGTPVDYQLYYSTSSTAPTAGSTPTVTGVTGLTTNLTGLTPGTTYYLWTRTNCGSGNTSVWTVSPVIFATACVSASIPTPLESFNASTLPACWSRTTVTGTVNWAPDTDNDGVPASHTGTRFMGKDWTNSDALLFSQPINMTTAPASGARINVWIYRNSINDATDRIRFHVNTTPDLSGSTQILEIYPDIAEAPAVPSNGWYNYTADIPSSFNTEPALYVIVQGTTSAGFAAYGIGFDDFMVEAIPSCVEPGGVNVSNTTTTGAQLDWTPPGSSTPVNYQVYYSTGATPPTAATTPSVSGITGMTTNLTGLTPGTTYNLWMRSFCGGSDYSVWTSSPVSFTTSCVTTTFFVQNFDGVTQPALPNCWYKVGATGLARTQNTSVNSAPNTMYIYSSSASDIAVVQMPPVSNLAAGNNSLTLKARANFTVGGVIEVGYLATPGDAASFNVITSFTANSLTYQDYTIPVPALPSGVEVLAFRHTGVPANSVLIDDIAYNGALPVVLKDFSGTKLGNANKLSWTTVSETNNRGFELERSADGRNFSAITFVASKAEGGNSNAILQYSYVDQLPLAGTSYYRLKQLDKDGRSSYSGIVELRTRIDEIRFSSVYPNPAKDELNLVISAPAAERVTILVTDLTGKVLLKQSLQLMQGDNQSQLRVQQLAAGTYLLKAICANGCETTTQRFVKQ